MFIFTYYISIILCYFLLSLKFIKDIFCFKPVKKWPQHRIFIILNSYFDKRTNPLPDINLISFIVDPYLYKNYSMNETNIIQSPENNTQSTTNIERSTINFIDENHYNEIRKKFTCKDNINMVFLYLKIFMLIFSTLAFWYVIQTDYKKDWTFILFIIIYIIILILSFSINFPLDVLNKRVSGYTKRSSNSLSFLISISISYFLSIFVFSAFLFITFIKSDINEENFNRFENLNYISINNSAFHRRDKVAHSFCYSGVHNLPNYLYQTFINDAYYYNYTHSSFNSSKYKKLFFSDDYEIKVIGNLTDLHSKHGVKMIQYNVRNIRNNVTILSIKGTSYKRDIYLDAQLYLPSILLHILNTFSTIDQQKETFSFKFIEFGLSVPYRILFQYSIIQNYLNELIKVYNKREKENGFSENVVLVGHSLGGGLAKIFGRIVGKQAISLSGPGVNAFHSLWKYRGNSSNFDLTTIDIIPDTDLVPRVEISGGTIYRILCPKSPLQCHSSELSLCESLVICRNPNAREYCSKVAGISESDINLIYDMSNFN